MFINYEHFGESFEKQRINFGPNNFQRIHYPYKILCIKSSLFERCAPSPYNFPHSWTCSSSPNENISTERRWGFLKSDLFSLLIFEKHSIQLHSRRNNFSERDKRFFINFLNLIDTTINHDNKFVIILLRRRGEINFQCLKTTFTTETTAR